MSTLPTILKKILDHKKEEISTKKKSCSMEKLAAICATMTKPRDFVGALASKIQQKQPAIIAEIKQASPSKGILRQPFEPVAIAKEYEAAGAACISILTDEQFFQGSSADLIAVHNAVSLPILRKDFIIDPYQVYETRAMGADCLLLIVSALDDDMLQSLCTLAIELQLAVLVESHTEEELLRALKLPTPLMGINNRNLHTFETRLTTSIDLASHIPADRIIISESGINTRADIAELQRHEIYSYLIGESLMRQKEIGVQLKALLAE